MRLQIRRRYYRKTIPGRPPIKYHVVERKDGVVSGTIMQDPILKKKGLKDLRRSLVAHEMREIKAFAQRHPDPDAAADMDEPRILRRLQNPAGFWREVARRGLRRG